MAKRFIDTGILKHHFTRGLPAPLKLLWIHILTDCTHAGMWQVDWKIAEIIIGQKINQKQAEKCFEHKIVKIKSGAIWFIPDFIDFQYGVLQEKNQAHRGIILMLKKENLLNPDFSVIKNRAPHEPLTSPSQGAKDMDMEEEMDKGMDMEKEKGAEIVFEKPDITINPHPFPISFLDQWDRWLEYKKQEHGEVYKAIRTQQTAYNQLVKMSESDEQKAIDLIDNAISKQWKGIYPLSENGKQHTSNNRKNAGANELDVLAKAARAGNVIDFSPFNKSQSG